MNTIFESLALTSSTLRFGTETASDYGPGFLGFIFTAAMVVAVIFLIRDMIRRVRRVRYTSEAEAKQQEMVSKGEERKLQEPDEPHDPKTDEQQ
ncbi:hypothetical protein [Glutamicibacter mysorens]|uniref:hypothetical protein n=1 Tax=Glutamicibacter mysorens TaxID=257984 RepID=UPI0020C5C3EA|nr:hypothetical protein [Glutamicibacter mysorens]UTM48149.1 hypothetical protein XH9_04895 [Glutamicibacter mysorens]